MISCFQVCFSFAFNFNLRRYSKAGQGKSGDVEGTDFAVLREVEAGAYNRPHFSSK
jgi:hypothetical protein